MRCSDRKIVRVVALLVFATALPQPAIAQVITWGQLTPHSGLGPNDWEIAMWIDQHFEDGNPGDGVVTSNILYIETQSFPEGADNFNRIVGEAVGDPATDTVSFTNTTYMAAQQPGLPTYEGGYHDQASYNLLPTITAGEMHSRAVRGSDSREYPRIRGNSFRKVLGQSSTHILFWAGENNGSEARDARWIVETFERASNTTIDILIADGSVDFGAGATSVGAATKENLRSKLQEIGQRMDDGPDEQFIFFITGRGNVPAYSSPPASVPAHSNGNFLPVPIQYRPLTLAVNDESNVPTVSFATGVDLNAIDPVGFGFDFKGEEFFGYNSDAVLGQLVLPDGSVLNTYTFDIDEAILEELEEDDDDSIVVGRFAVSNFTNRDVIFEGALAYMGSVARLEGDRTPDDDGDRLSLAALARASGAGADFSTRWDLANTGHAEIDVQLTFTPRSDTDGPPITRTITVTPGVVREIEDPLAEMFGLTSGTAVGAVEVVIEGPGIGAFHLNSTVSATLPDGSQYGQFFPAVGPRQTIPAGGEALFTTTVDPLRYRVNSGSLALVNGTRVLVQPVKPISSPLHAGVTLELDAGQSAQINDLDATFDLGGEADYFVRMSVLEGAATGYVSVLDGRDGSGTSDPVTVLQAAPSSERVTLLELGSIQGVNEFAGSAIFSNFAQTQTRVSADYLTRGEAGVRATTEIVLPAERATSYPDVVADLFGIQGEVGSIVLTVLDGGPIAATGREFAVFRDASGEVVGTAGQRIPGLLDEDRLTAGLVWHFIGLRQRETPEGLERSHITILNPDGATKTVTIEQFDGVTGESEGAIERTVEPGQLIRINNLLEVIAPGQNGEVKRIELTTTGDVFAEVFRVNPTGDPITIDPN